MKKLKCVILASCLLSSCTSTRWKATEVPLDQTKSLVVEAMGSPERSWRKDGQDYWYYNPSSTNPEERVILVFQNGRLVQKIQPGSSPEFDELEQELKMLKPDSSGPFETLSE